MPKGAKQLKAQQNAKNAKKAKNPKNANEMRQTRNNQYANTVNPIADPIADRVDTGTSLVAGAAKPKKRSPPRSSSSSPLDVKILCYPAGNSVPKNSDCVNVCFNKDFAKVAPTTSYQDFKAMVVAECRSKLDDPRFETHQVMLLYAEKEKGGRTLHLMLLDEDSYEKMPLALRRQKATCLQLAVGFRLPPKSSTASLEEGRAAKRDASSMRVAAPALAAAKKKRKAAAKFPPVLVLNEVSTIPEGVKVAVLLRMGVQLIQQGGETDQLRSKSAGFIHLIVETSDAYEIMDVQDCNAELLPKLQALLDNNMLTDSYTLDGQVYRWDTNGNAGALLDVHAIMPGEMLIFQKTPAKLEGLTTAHYVLLLAVGDSKNRTPGNEYLNGVEIKTVLKVGNSVTDKLTGKLGRSKWSRTLTHFFDGLSRENNLYYTPKHVDKVVELAMQGKVRDPSRLNEQQHLLHPGEISWGKYNMKDPVPHNTVQPGRLDAKARGAMLANDRSVHLQDDVNGGRAAASAVMPEPSGFVEPTAKSAREQLYDDLMVELEKIDKLRTRGIMDDTECKEMEDVAKKEFRLERAALAGRRPSSAQLPAQLETTPQPAAKAAKTIDIDTHQPDSNNMPPPATPVFKPGEKVMYFSITNNRWGPAIVKVRSA
jgi:hypothetical protein